MADMFDKAASTIGSFGRSAVPIAMGTAVLGIGGVAAANKYKTSQAEGPDRAAEAVGKGTSTALYGGVAAGGLYAISAGPVKKAMANIGTKPITAPKLFSNTTPLNKDLIKSISSKPLMAGGVGAALGAAVGSQVNEDNPTLGATLGAGVGAVAGTAGSFALKGQNIWNKIGPIGRSGAILGLAAVIAGGTRAFVKNPEYQSESISQPDGMGGYSNTESSGVKSRLNKMNASGDLVFGLNNKR